jgi:hypothetical protein
MIDVLAFPPDKMALDELRVAQLARCRRLEQRARVALFVSIGLALAWAADVGAAFESRPGVLTLGFGVASLALALAVCAAHVFARRLVARAAALRQRVEQRFADVRVADAQPLLAHAAADRVVAQYLRMVGRQQRPLRAIELTSLIEWAERLDTAPDGSRCSAPPPSVSVTRSALHAPDVDLHVHTKVVTGVAEPGS